MKLQENFILVSEKVDEIVVKVREYLQANKVLKTDVNKAALLIGHLGDGITFSVVTLGVASIFDISISISQLMILVICEIVFSFSVPPVSGGALALLLMLMHQISAPAECTVVCVALVFFVDFMGTSTTVVNIMNGVLLCKNKMNDKETRSIA